MSSGEHEQHGLIAGRYRPVRQLGRGGMGVVWRAVDEVLGREVAVKELRTYTDSSGPELDELRLRMRREARAAARVRHPGVVAVHDIADHQGRPVIVMELVDGPSLADVLAERGLMDPREAAGIGAKVLEALAAAHAVGVLHRDVKPGNVLLDLPQALDSARAGETPIGRVVLTDFGIAAMEDPGDGSGTHLTRSGELVGSLDYLAPERAQGQQPGPASDVWALGATLYAAVEGGSPFRRTSTWSTLTAIVSDPLPEPRRAGPLGPVLQRLMDKDPARRPDAESAARLLAALADGTGSRAGAAPAPVPAEAAPASPPQGFGPPPAVPGGFGSGGFGPATVPPQGGGVPGAAPVAGPGAPTPGAEAGTAVSARPRGAKGRSRALVSAAVAAVVLAGGGITYGLTDRDTTASAGHGSDGGGDGPGPAGERPDGGEGLPLTPGDDPSGSASPSASESTAPPASASASVSTTASRAASPSPSRTQPPPGDDGDGDGGGAGGTDGGATGTTGGGGPDGGSSSTTTTGGGSSGSTSGGTTARKPTCFARGDGKYDCTVWKTAKSYWKDGREAGILNAGKNYFYCQSDLGRRVTEGRWTNVWWGRTDDDSRNADVWVSIVYVEGGDNDGPVPGLPVC